ncbi:MAG: fumarate hydratase [Eubacteriales bacterium]|uniref:fumarate hydratase n=1 Tax=Fenollaria TaxID=1686313 RepID=UPI0026EB9C90|nr:MULTISPECIES: fumarate hydratase [Fenollaria]MDD7339204.1 fumarate hydratase [Eubacteriales bacterium]MDY3106200.1 fumarate hydratase [Fenollaria sp.]
MREVKSSDITKKLKEGLLEIASVLPKDVMDRLVELRDKEKWPLAKETITTIIDNDNLAERDSVPMCQDTGMVICFVKIGQDVHVDGSISDAINEAVREAYTEGYLRKSVVKDPINRVNTKDNTPAIIHYELVEGDVFEISFAAKGFGSENMSKQKMLKPADGLEGVKKFILESVEAAGPNPCPPIIVGVGIGGDFEKSCIMAKKSLMRDVNDYNKDPFYADLEKELLEKINELGIGPQGFGGKTTALRVFIETHPTHIAGLPVAVNIQCHAARHKVISL